MPTYAATNAAKEPDIHLYCGAFTFAYVGIHAPTADMAGMQTAKAQRLISEEQIINHNERLAVAINIGIKVLAEQINVASTHAMLTCNKFASHICFEAFPEQPNIHEDIYDELVIMLKQYFEALKYRVCLNDLNKSFVEIELHWGNS
jgi:hypothetical protein